MHPSAQAEALRPGAIQKGWWPLIDGVRTKKLKVIPDERGRLMEMLRSDDELFCGFGQAYLTTAYPGVVKAWHYHRLQTDHFVVVRGMMKVVLYDDREDSPTRGEVNEFFLGEHNPTLLRIPPMVLHGFKCIGTEEAMVINLPDRVYNYQHPDEYRTDPHQNDIPYDWARRDG
jgi:dTDP-4-dehydrorhamnose 3,5-epimerase